MLRASTPAGITQEVYALLIAYQALRTALANATLARPDIGHDRLSFTISSKSNSQSLRQTQSVSPLIALVLSEALQGFQRDTTSDRVWRVNLLWYNKCQCRTCRSCHAHPRRPGADRLCSTSTGMMTTAAAAPSTASQVKSRAATMKPDARPPPAPASAMNTSTVP